VTTAIPAPDVAPSAEDANSASDFHLVESAGRWVLTINLTPRVRDALAAESGPRPGTTTDADFTVHVEPNLLPGEPFPVSLELLRPEAPSD
jgi:hypothetical protein